MLHFHLNSKALNKDNLHINPLLPEFIFPSIFEL